jgi:hypothetical protein
MASPSDQAPLLPRSLRDRLEAWVCGVLGYALMGLCLAAAASLLTWSAADPSFTRVTDGTVRNALGIPGASLADLAMRLFGLASVVMILPPAFWALQLITRRQLEDGRMKLMLAPAAVLLLACAASGLPVPAKWPLPYGLGGLLGDQALKSLSGIFVAGAGPEWSTVTAAAICLTGGLILLTGSLGMSLRDLRLICQVPRPRLDLIGRSRRWLRRSLDDSGRNKTFVRVEPTLDPRMSGAAVVSDPFPIEPAFDYQPRVAPASTGAPVPATDKRLEIRRPVRDPEFERSTETGCRAMAERFAPTREEPAPPGTGPGLLRRALPKPGSHAAGERLPPGTPPERRPVWPGSVPAAVEAAMPHGADYPPGRSASDELYGRAVAVVRADRKASAEYLQQRLGIAYMQAANLIDRMEQEGIVGPPIWNGVRPILAGPPRPRTV